MRQMYVYNALRVELSLLMSATFFRDSETMQKMSENSLTKKEIFFL